MTDHIVDANKKVDHIIKAAGECGIEMLAIDGVIHEPELERFYAIAYKAGMERAAEIARCEWVTAAQCEYGFALYDAIRAEAHVQNQPKNIHDSAVMSKN